MSTFIRRRRHSGASRVSITAATILACSVGALCASAASAHGRLFHFNIRSEPLSHALETYAQICGRQIIFTKSVLAGTGTISLVGDFTTDDALRRLLAGTQLIVERSPSGALMIRRHQRATTNTAPVADPSPVARIQPRAQGQAVGLSTIVVTANKVKQNVQNVALAVTAITSAQLAQIGVQDLQGVARFVPSARFQEEGVQREIYLRGIGSTNDVATEDPPNAFNFNGVYFQREATGFALYDIADVEVVPGPQNTLYGRSALGGTVNVTAKKPVPYFEASGIFGYGNYNEVNATGVLNVPLSSNFAVRAAYDHLSHDGYETTGADNRNENSARLSILGHPSKRLRIYAWGMYDHQGGYGSNLVNKGRDPVTGATGQQWDNTFLRANPWNDTIPSNLNPFAPVKTYPRRYDLYASGAQIDYNLGGATLTYVPGFTKVDMDNRYTFTAIPLIQINHSRSISQELRLVSSKNSRVQWIAGLYYFDYRSRGHLYAFSENPLTDLYDDPHSNSGGEAVFGQASYPLTDKLTLTAGARYSWNHRHVFGYNTPAPYDYDKDFNDPDGKLGVAYHVTGNSMVYTSFQTGSQMGTFNTRPNSPANPALIKSPRLFAYSIGTKNVFLENRLEVDDEAFYYDYRNFIVSAFDAHGGTISQNAKKFEIYGNDLTLKALITQRDQINLAVGYLHARYTDFITNPVPVTGQTNFAGYQGQYAPDWTITEGYQHTFDLPGSAALTARVNSQFESSYPASFYDPPGGRQSDYTRTDASMTYYPPSGKWSVTAWVKNIENAAVEAATASGAVPGPAGTFLMPPRTFGIRFTAQMR